MTPARWRKARLTIVWLLSLVPFALLFFDTFMLTTLVLSGVHFVVFVYMFIVFVAAEKSDLEVWPQYLGSFVVFLLAFPLVVPKRILFLIDRSKLVEAAGIIQETNSLPTTFRGGVQTFIDFGSTDTSQCIWVDRGATGPIGYCHSSARGEPAHRNALVAIPLGDGWYYVIED